MSVTEIITLADHLTTALLKKAADYWIDELPDEVAAVAFTDREHRLVIVCNAALEVPEEDQVRIEQRCSDGIKGSIVYVVMCGDIWPREQA